MSSKSDLRIDWCSYEAAKYACEHWHYSGCIPAGKRAMLGVWEHDRFIGAVVFSTGACPQIHRPFGVLRQEIAELTRVALTEHSSAVSRIVKVALLILRRAYPKLRLIVSYADPEQGHLGKIYQAGNWFYLGRTKPCEHFVVSDSGRRIHSKTLRTGKRKYATTLLSQGVIVQRVTWKYKYAYPLDKAARILLETMSQPYSTQASEA